MGCSWSNNEQKRLQIQFEKAKIESKSVSAQLVQLEKNNRITKKPTSIKNNFYQIKDRFFNIWYLMRYGKKMESNKVKWLIRFIEAWHDDSAITYNTKKQLEEKNRILVIRNNIRLSMTLLWNDEIEEAVKYSKEIINSEENFIEYMQEIGELLILIIAKKQYNYVSRIFAKNEYEIKNHYKLIYYSLIKIMKNDTKDEYIKMGDELEETVQSVMKKIEEYSQK